MTDAAVTNSRIIVQRFAIPTLPDLVSHAAASYFMDRSSPELSGGEWKTIRGAKVYIKDGVAIAGAAHLIGKTAEGVESHADSTGAQKKRSIAKLVFGNERWEQGPRKQAVEGIMKSFGVNASSEDLPELVGAPDDATVTTDVMQVVGSKNNPSYAHISVKVDHPDFTSKRNIKLKRQDDGTVERIIENEDFRVKNGRQGKGLGADIFSHQVHAATDAGFSEIRCHAARYNEEGDSKFNGYYTWPRLGYDMALDDESNFGKMKYAAMRKKFPYAKSILDVMGLPEGREWWKNNGSNLFEAKFDLSHGSRSHEVLNAYLAARAN